MMAQKRFIRRILNSQECRILSYGQQLRWLIWIFFGRTYQKVRFLTLRLNVIQSNLDGSFTMANSNSFLSPNEILPIAQENKYLGKFS